MNNSYLSAKFLPLSFLIIIFLSLEGLAQEASFDYSKRTTRWQKRNSHLIPSEKEQQAILRLDQDADGIPNGQDEDMDQDGISNETDSDIDGDEVINKYDPSPFDWREIGYNPFGILAFLSWRHPWNCFKYSKKDLEKAVRLLKELGITFVRMDFYWQDIEPDKGRFNFTKYDYIVELLAKNQIRILAILDYSTDWTSSAWNRPPDNLDDFANFAKETVSRYKNRIKYWEIWNEPDSNFYWSPQDDMKTYAKLLKKPI